jgi:hypothetical protein
MLLSAHRAGAVRGIDFDIVGQFEQFAVQAVVHHLGHHLRRVAFAAGEIGRPTSPMKSVSPVKSFCGSSGCGDENADAFGRVAGRFDEAQRNAPIVISSPSCTRDAQTRRRFAPKMICAPVRAAIS